MSGQVACPVSDASIHMRQNSGILTPASDASLSPHEVPEQGSRKRKRGVGSMEDLLHEVMVVKPYPSTITTKPRTLRPIALLPRSDLPLSSIDMSSGMAPLPESRKFESHVKSLELEHRMGTMPMVLIARLDDNRSHYAVELESRGLYVLCKLGAWVDLDRLCNNAVVSTIVPRPTIKVSAMTNAFSSYSNASCAVTPEASKFNKKKRLAIEAIQSMVKKPVPEQQNARSVAVESDVIRPNLTTAQPVLDELREPEIGPTHEDVVLQPTSSELFDNIRAHYLEALYLSKASLAYFSKGPLSRARSTFHLDYDSTLNMKDLTDFLSTMVLSTSVLDKKYKDSVPEVLSRMETGTQSGEDVLKGSARKPRKPKKVKVGKNGLYPIEDAMIRKWWDIRESDPEFMTPGDSLNDIRRKWLSELRIRETQLQIIVILEILALLPLVQSEECVQNSLPFAGNQKLSETPATFMKGRRPKDLTVLVDVHVDRLCIWQSVAVDDGISGNSEKTETSSTSNQKHAADILREFCVEVVMPFYLARLPEQCTGISRKLGGPTSMTPGRPKMAKSNSTPGGISKPGAATKRSVPAKPARSLRRVLTDERHSRNGSRGPSGAISLMRSATAPNVPNLKRESSESPSMSGIPTTDSQALQVSRGGVLKSKRFSAREVDFSNLTNITDIKIKQTNNIEAELKEAIANLKKPNRQLAGQEIMETAERRALGASNIRKTKKPIRNPSFPGIQIMATPRSNRQKDMMPTADSMCVEDRLQLPQLPQLPQLHSETVPPSSAPRIPQSVLRPGVTVRVDLTPALAKPSRGQLLFSETPTRRASTNNFELGCIPPSSPLQARQANSARHLSTYSAPSLGIETLRTPMKSQMIFATPMKHSQKGGDELVCPDSDSRLQEVKRVARAIVEEEEDSLYKSLGWDDIDDL